MKIEQRNSATAQQRNSATAQQRNSATAQQRNSATSGWRLTWTSAFLLTAALLCWAPVEQSQAQLVLTIRPSASDTNNPVFVFSGSTTASASEGIRSTLSGGYEAADTFEVQNLYSIATLTNVFRSLSPLSALDADDPDRLAEGDSAPTITIAGTNALTITHIAFDSQPILGNHDLGIVANQYYFYSASETVSWSGAGILTTFNMSQFNPGTYQSSAHPNFSNHALSLTVNSRAIPEPKEYALIFALFALAFVIVRRHLQKKQREQSITS